MLWRARHCSPLRYLRQTQHDVRYTIFLLVPFSGNVSLLALERDGRRVAPVCGSMWIRHHDHDGDLQLFRALKLILLRCFCRLRWVR